MGNLFAFFLVCLFLYSLSPFRMIGDGGNSSDSPVRVHKNNLRRQKQMPYFIVEWLQWGLQTIYIDRII